MSDRVDDAMEMFEADTGIRSANVWVRIDKVKDMEDYGKDFLIDMLRWFSVPELDAAFRNAIDDRYINDDRHNEEGEDETD